MSLPTGERKRRRKYAVAMVVATALGLGIPGAWENYVASLGPLDYAPARQGSTIAVDRNGQLLRAFTTSEGRWRLPLETQDVDPRFLAMLKGFEDNRFESHRGVDWRAMVRALEQAITNGKVVSGGSTLTMQVARLLEPRDERTLPAKLRQIVRAMQIERELTKKQILDLYLVLAPYGGNLEGLRAASIAYFGKEPKRLSFGEQALLVAIPQSPEVRRPDRAAESARRARDRVIDRAVQRGLITREEGERAKNETVPVQRHPFPANAPHATEAARAATPDRRILQFSYDRSLQVSLEGLLKEHVERLDPKITGAIVVIDNRSGHVLARVGSADYFANERAGAVEMTNALRSPGSALKPFIYALAFENGIAHPETMVDDRRTRYGIYAPENFDLTYQGQVSARVALQMSLNIPAVALLNEVSPPRFLARLKNAGVNIVLPREAPPGLALALGGLGVTLTDLARLYSGIARGGEMPALIERLDAPRPQPTGTTIAEPVASWYVADVLRGTPPPANALAGKISFKTGTSYGYRDAIAAGFDSRVTIAVWLGRADNGAVHGLVARQAAAPVLFDAFARIPGAITPVRRPPNALVARTSELPPPLRSLRKDTPKALVTARTSELKIAYPPQGARVDLGLQRGAVADALLALKVQGGVAPFTWIVNGAPIGSPEHRRQSSWTPDGAGFARVSVIDAKGTTDSVLVRLE
jgi:penicillin-binding protein 1C